MVRIPTTWEQRHCTTYYACLQQDRTYMTVRAVRPNPLKPLSLPACWRKGKVCNFVHHYWDCWWYIWDWKRYYYCGYSNTTNNRWCRNLGELKSTECQPSRRDKGITTKVHTVTTSQYKLKVQKRWGKTDSCMFRIERRLIQRRYWKSQILHRANQLESSVNRHSVCPTFHQCT